jgi:hypothetical protein
MRRTLMKSNIHRATVTDANLHYLGSVTIDALLMRAADIPPYERVEIYNVTNGERLATYADPRARPPRRDLPERRRRAQSEPRRPGNPGDVRRDGGGRGLAAGSRAASSSTRRIASGGQERAGSGADAESFALPMSS